MPRCFTIRKHSAQHNSMQQQQHEQPLPQHQPKQHHQPSRKIAGNSDGKSSEDFDGKKTHTKVAVIQRATNRNSATKKPYTKSKNTVDGRHSRINRESTVGNSISSRSNRSNQANSEWKSTVMQRKKLENSTNAAAQQQCKMKATGPTSPTEATIAPIYYNGNTNDSRNEGVIISSKTNDYEQLSYETKENYQLNSCVDKSSEVLRAEITASNHVSIILKNEPTQISSELSSSIETNASVLAPSSHLLSSPVVYKPVQSVIQSTNSNGCHIPNTINVPIESLSTNHITRSTLTNDRDYGEKNSPSSTTVSNQYFVLRSTTESTPPHNGQPPVYRERSIEETEAAHDLLSLSQSLPPLPAPCVVTILHPVTNYNGNSPDVQEITPNRSNEYITYTSGRNVHYTSDRNDIYARSKKSVSTQFDADMLPEDSSSSDVNPQITPLTPPTSESSSSDVEFISDAGSTNTSTNSANTSTQKAKSQTTNNNNNNTQKPQKTKSAQVFGMTIFDAVMINDGRSKKGNGDAEVIHIEERRKGRYKCPQCGKQYATSSNLSRHKQTHRSLDSQSAKKCNTCGKAYVSMPALAMHLLTHKLTHSCDVCGKLFSRPWLLQGHLRSHTGEKPYGCAHCGKAFADRSNLRAHMQTHSVNKQFECSKCRKTFALKSYLNKHLESSCLRDDCKKSNDDKRRNDFDDHSNDASMDDDTIDVTDCSPQADNSVDDFGDDDDDEDINIIT